MDSRLFHVLPEGSGVVVPGSAHRGANGVGQVAIQGQGAHQQDTDGDRVAGRRLGPVPPQRPLYLKHDDDDRSELPKWDVAGYLRLAQRPDGALFPPEGVAVARPGQVLVGTAGDCDRV